MWSSTLQNKDSIGNHLVGRVDGGIAVVGKSAALLHLLLALQHFLLDLLRVADREAGRALRFGLRGRLFVIGIVVVCGSSTAGRRCLSAVGGLVPDREKNLARSTLALIPHHEDVIAGSLQKQGQNIAGLAGTEGTEDALILREAFDGGSGCG